MKVWIATYEEDYRGGHVVGVHATKEGAKALCQEPHSEAHPLEWHPGASEEDGDENARASTIASYIVAPHELGGAIDFARRAATAGRRATNDPGAFVKRGPDNDGEPYGERLDQWQARALEAALEKVVA